MTDLEMTKLCAEAMGIEYFSGTKYVSLLRKEGDSDLYDPLHDDAQAMALVKKFDIALGRRTVWIDGPQDVSVLRDADLNRAIVMVVAKMQKAKLDKPTNT